MLLDYVHRQFRWRRYNDGASAVLGQTGGVGGLLLCQLRATQHDSGRAVSQDHFCSSYRQRTAWPPPLGDTSSGWAVVVPCVRAAGLHQSDHEVMPFSLWWSILLHRPAVETVAGLSRARHESHTVTCGSKQAIRGMLRWRGATFGRRMSVPTQREVLRARTHRGALAGESSRPGVAQGDERRRTSRFGPAGRGRVHTQARRRRGRAKQPSRLVTGLLDGSNGGLCRCAEPENVLLSTSLGQVGRDGLAALNRQSAIATFQ